MTYDGTDPNDDGTVEADVDNQSVTTESISLDFPTGNYLQTETILEDSTGDLSNLTYDTGQVPGYDFLVFSYWAIPDSTANMFMSMRLNGHSGADYQRQMTGGGETTGASSFSAPGTNSGTPFGGKYLITTTKFADRLPDSVTVRNASVSLISAAYPPTESDPTEYGRLAADVGVINQIELTNANNNGGSAFVHLEGVNLPR